MIALAVVTLLLGAGESRAFSRAEIGLEPVRAHTDLGPVVVRQTTNVKKLRGELQVLADRVGADGFIIEERSPFAVYGQQASSALDPGPAFDVSSARVDPGCPTQCYNGFSFEFSRRVVLGEITIAQADQARRELLAD